MRGRSPGRALLVGSVAFATAMWGAGVADAQVSYFAPAATPNPQVMVASHLQAVSCASASACMAVGSGQQVDQLAERWTGSSWVVQTLPSLSGQEPPLAGVSCPSTTFCMAVGNYVSDGVEVTLAESWNGTSWSVVPPANPAGASASLLSGVACASPTACTAVGTYKASGESTPSDLVEQWNGTSWTIEVETTPAGALGSSLYGVACGSATSCVAVGSTDTGSPPTFSALIEQWNGTSWTVATSPPGPTDAELLGVACGSATTCTAVGNYESSVGVELTLAEEWSGSKWSLTKTPSPSITDSSLNAVSCVSATSCTAVGSRGSSGDEYALGEVWNGTTWAVAAVPSAPTGTNTLLEGVSCIATTALCAAVGFTIHSQGPDTTVTELANGTAWRIFPSPNATTISGDSNLVAASCATSTSCVAVGSYANDLDRQVPLAETWSGTTWTISVAPPVAGAAETYLTAVSCASTTMCMAVGYYQTSTTSSETYPLADEWNGTTWSIEAAPLPSGTTVGELLAVSCPATSLCVQSGTRKGRRCR